MKKYAAVLAVLAAAVGIAVVPSAANADSSWGLKHTR